MSRCVQNLLLFGTQSRGLQRYFKTKSLSSRFARWSQAYHRLTVFWLFWPRLSLFFQPVLRVQELPTAAPFGDIAAQTEAVAPGLGVPGVTRDENVLLLAEAGAVRAESFGVPSVVFV